MKILIIGDFHHKNKEGIERILSTLSIEYMYGNINNISSCDIIVSPSMPINTQLFPTKKFIFGPHFSVFPDNKLAVLNNISKNAIYTQPSEWVSRLWNNANQILPVKTFPFPVNTDKFMPIEDTIKDKVFIYFKRRRSEELTFITSFLEKNNIEYKIFDYVNRYSEEEYIDYLQHSKYGIILDAHESQGFAIEEALSCNVPLLVWNVTTMQQEAGSNYPPIPATSIPYWDNRCGEYFYKYDKFKETYDKFIKNIDKYQPRQYIMENLSIEKCSERFINLIKDI
jgi:hypothetical protein